MRAGIAAALLFGAGTPFAKMLLGDVTPWLLAGLLYTGSGVGLGLYRLLRRAPGCDCPGSNCCRFRVPCSWAEFSGRCS